MSELKTMLLVWALLVAAVANAQDKVIPRLDQQATIDGTLDGVWSDALHVELLVETRPGDNIPPPVETDVYLYENGKALFVAFRAADPDPTQIQAFLRDRDSAYSDDFVGIVLDTYNDGRRALQFFANPFGVQMDMINDDVNGNEDDSWDAIWDSSGVIHDFGYVVEMRIPFDALSFPDSDRLKTFGVDLLRFYPRDARHRISNNPLERGRNCYLCQLEKIQGFAGVTPGRDLLITPTLTVGRVDERADLSSPLVNGSFDEDLGVDISWGITPNWTLNGTLNPDFSQIEVDSAQLNVNNTFALFFPERRPFFLDDADYFNSNIRLVNTRTMGDPDYGLRVTGKTGDNTVGAFVVEDTVTNLLIPGVFGSDAEALEQSSTNAALRYRRDLGGTSTIGVLATGRDGDDYHNRMVSLDARWQPSSDHTFRFLLANSQTEYPDVIAQEYDQSAEPFSGNAVQVRYNYNTRNHYIYSRYEDFDENFRPDLGFLNQVGIDRVVAGTGYVWWGEEQHWWDRIELGGDWDITHDFTGRVIERELEAFLESQGPMQSYMRLGGGVRERFWDDAYFDEDFVYVDAEFKPFRGWELGMFVRQGDSVDFANTQLGEVTRYQFRSEYALGHHFTGSLRHTYETFDRDEGELYDVHLTDWRMAWQFDLRQRLRLTVQRLELERNPALYVDTVDAELEDLGYKLVYSYKVNPRTVLFAGYSDLKQRDDVVTDLTQTARTLFFKIGYAWQP